MLSRTSRTSSISESSSPATAVTKSPEQVSVSGAHERVGNQAILASLPKDQTSDDPEEAAWQKQLDEFESRYRAMVDAARILGFDVAADNLEYFLAGTGGVRPLPVSWLRSFDAVLNAERTNQERFEASLKRIAAEMNDGETRVVTDHWDRLLTANPASELYYASGTSTLSSTGTFTLQKHQGSVEVSGEVSLTWKDPYDWHPGATAFVPGFGVAEDKDARSLVFERGAREFDMVADWKQTLTGRIQVVEWWPDTEEFQWSGP